MKKVLLIFSGIMMITGIMAQVPQGITHQAVMRNSQNQPIVESPIGVRISILQGGVNGEAVYVETHNPISNVNGLITYVIGHGAVESGLFAEIDWSAGPYFLKTEADSMGGTDYTITGVTQFHSMPYALYSETAKVAEKVIGSVSPNIQPPTVYVTEATNIEEFSATINGIVNGEGFLTNVVFEWGTTPSYGNTVTAIPSPVTGSDDVQVSAFLSNLQSATTYHYRINASNAVDIIYSEDMSFTTGASVPQLTTNPITAISPFSAVSGGNITYDGGFPVNERGVVWSTESNPNIDDHEGITNDGEGDGSFFSELTELSPGIFYYVRAYATNDIGTAYGTQRTFTTLGSVPNATTLAASDITTTSAVLNGVINPKHLSTAVVFEYGLTTEYSSTVTSIQSPVDGSDDVLISAYIEGLSNGTTYYFRIVGENELGVSYGNQMQFNTYDTLTDIDNNIYYTIIIGDQEWMTENLRVSKYNNGDAIPTGLSNLDWSNTIYGAYAIFDHDHWNAYGIDSPEEMVAAYGKLYNWYAATDTRGLCPEGWRIPSDDDWLNLLEYIATFDDFYLNNYGEMMINNNIGNALKSCRQIGSPLGEDCDVFEHPRWEYNQLFGTDDFGFSALPASRRFSNGNYLDFGYIAFWWSSSHNNETDIASWWAAHGMHENFNWAGDSKRIGNSIRCMRDTAAPTSYNLNLTVNPIGAGNVTGAGDYEAGEEVSITAVANFGWEFIEWSGDTEYLDDVTAPNAIVTMPVDDIVTLTANFLEVDMGLPIVVTFEATDVTQSSAIVSGQVIDTGDEEVLSRGICWSTHSPPTLFDSFNEEGAGLGTFTSTILGLVGNTTYYVRAFATNSQGVAYGNQVNFTTEPAAIELPEVFISSLNTAQPGLRVIDAAVIDDGGAEVTDRGVVWDMEENPSHEQNEGYFTDGAGLGEFTVYLYDLIPNTKYYIRAFATNSEGTQYSEQKFFYFWDYHDTVTDVDNNIYNTVLIGDQEWMAENLRVSRYRNFIPITTGLNDVEWSSTSQGAYAIYQNNTNMLIAYGKLYNWYAVNHSIGLCPTGWSVPSDDDWSVLVNYVASQGFPNSNVTDGTGNALKSCRQIGSPLGGDCCTSTHPRWDADGIHHGFDEFGFSGLPGGLRYSSGSFSNIGSRSLWWSATEFNVNNAWYFRGMFSNFGDATFNHTNKKAGFSIRCIKNTE